MKQKELKILYQEHVLLIQDQKFIHFGKQLFQLQ